MKLIPLDAVLAEIEKLKGNVPYFPTIAEEEAYKEGVDSACCKVNSLEGKEVDLNKEIDKYTSDNYYGSETLGFFANRTDKEPDGVDIVLCAKHFFELGLSVSNKAQKGEEV